MARTPHSGPTFLDFPLDQAFMEAEEKESPAPTVTPWSVPGAPSRDLGHAAALLRDAERPAIMAGTGLYWGRCEEAVRELAEELQIPVFLKGLGRGSWCVSRRSLGRRSSGRSKASVPRS